MVHADATKFDPGAPKEVIYARVLAEAESLFDGQRNWVCNLANAASLLWYAYQSLPYPSNQVNWAGFYTLSPTPPHNLILAPFHGKPACQSIRPSQGVCGTAFSSQRPILVPDTHAFPGHIACDAESRSEIVIPIFLIGPEGQDAQAKAVVGVIDVDCKVESGFDQVDLEWLTRLAGLIGRSCDWVPLAAAAGAGAGANAANAAE